MGRLESYEDYEVNKRYVKVLKIIRVYGNARERLIKFVDENDIELVLQTNDYTKTYKQLKKNNFMLDNHKCKFTVSTILNTFLDEPLSIWISYLKLECES